MKEIKLNKLKEKIYYDKCDNGLDIYMWVNEKTNNYYATLNVNYGSMDTDFKLKNEICHTENGIAPFYGFHTVKLTSEIPVKENDNFTVIMKKDFVPIIDDSRMHYEKQVHKYWILEYFAKSYC